MNDPQQKDGKREKSWHFDPDTDPTGREAALSEGKPYQLLEATDKDKKKAVAFYNLCPVPGYEIGSVKVIYNRTFNVKFEAHLKTLQQKEGNPAFVPKWSSMTNPALRQKTNTLFEEMSEPYTDPDYPAVKLIPTWHGTKRGILDSIFQIGYSNLSEVDSGYFGKGLYSTYEAKYSYEVYSTNQGINGEVGALIMNWVASFSALPVINNGEYKPPKPPTPTNKHGKPERYGDMCFLTGKGNYGNYDAHFIPVVPENPNNPKETVFFPCNADQTPMYTEVVVFESAACLPRYLVELQSTAPQLPKLIEEKKKEEWVGLYLYETREKGYLNFKPGDTINILEKSGQWWEGELNGKTGKVPSNYIKPKENKENPENPEKGLVPPLPVIPHFSPLPQPAQKISGSSSTLYQPQKSFPADYECQITLKDHQKAVLCVAALPNGNVVSGSSDSMLKVWDMSTGNCINLLQDQHSSYVRGVCVLPNGNLVSVSEDKTIKVWDLNTGLCINTLKGHGDAIRCAAVLPNGHVITGSGDDTLKVWDLNKPSGLECVQTLKGHGGLVYGVAGLPNNRAISGSADNTLKIWDLNNGRCIHTLKGHGSSVLCLAVLPDGKIISGSSDYTLKLWDLTKPQGLEFVQTFKGHSSHVRCVAVLPNGHIISGSEDKTLKEWDITTGKCVNTLQGHTSSVLSLTVLPNGQIISGSADKTVKVWTDKNELKLSNKKDKKEDQSLGCTK